MSTAIAPLAPSLFELEQDLLALMDTTECVQPEQEAEFMADLSAALQRSIEKRDRCAAFLRHMELQQQNCDSEIHRLQERKRSFEAAEKRMRQYVQAVIESIGPDDKGKFPKLEGKTATFSLRAKPTSVAVTDEESVPAEFKSLTVTVRLSIWQQLLLAAGFDLIQSESPTVSIRKAEIRKAIEAGQEVPGADLCIGGHTLQIK